MKIDMRQKLIMLASCLVPIEQKNYPAKVRTVSLKHVDSQILEEINLHAQKDVVFDLIHEDGGIEKVIILDLKVADLNDKNYDVQIHLHKIKDVINIAA